MAGLVLWVAFITEPVIVTRPVRVLTDRLVLLVRGRKHGVDLGVGHRLALDPHLMTLPSLSISHHLGDQIPSQPHLSRLAPTGASAWRLVHERPAHPLAHGQTVLPDGFHPLATSGGRQLIASTTPAVLGLADAAVRLSIQAETLRPRS